MKCNEMLKCRPHIIVLYFRRVLSDKHTKDAHGKDNTPKKQHTHGTEKGRR